jgi:cyclic beta-1,2-glucan synthetase
VEHYVRVTGDWAILHEHVPFLDMRVLEPGEDEIYDLPQVTAETLPLSAHCLLALSKACTSGPHGLPLIGTGDWNDGMNRVGREGRGESVWLAWFLISTLRKFAALVEQRDERVLAVTWKRRRSFMSRRWRRTAGMARGTAARTSMMARRSGAARVMSAALMRSRRAGV